MEGSTWEEIVAAVANNAEKVTCVNMSLKGIGEKGACSLAKAMKGNTRIAGNEIGDEGATAICMAILENNKTKLIKLDLSDNAITEAAADIMELIREKDIKLNIEGNPLASVTIRKKKKLKSSKKKRTSKKRVERTRSETMDSTGVEIPNSRKKILEGRLQALQAKELEYISQVEELEGRIKDLSRGKLSMLNTVFSPRKSKTAMTVSTKSIIITQKISEGGGSSAEIYSCLVDGWSVVMKELATSTMSQSSIEAFSREIRLLELMPAHPNIVRYLFHEVKDNFLRLFMTQYDCSLGYYIRGVKESGDRIPLKTIYRILMDVVRGIEFLHSQNIMHRDLKSENIFVLYGERKEIQLCAIGDFDTAKQVSNTKTVLGTPSWMAPEVMAASSTEGYSFPCDIYSFGMIIYELISLQIPFHDMNAMRIPMLVMQGNKPSLPDDLPKEYNPLVTLFEQCSEKEPDSRPLPAKLKTSIALSLANL